MRSHMSLPSSLRWNCVHAATHHLRVNTSRRSVQTNITHRYLQFKRWSFLQRAEHRARRGTLEEEAGVLDGADAAGEEEDVCVRASDPRIHELLPHRCHRLLRWHCRARQVR
eukprot:2354409-Rhodomonas_salina.2